MIVVVDVGTSGLRVSLIDKYGLQSRKLFAFLSYERSR